MIIKAPARSKIALIATVQAIPNGIVTQLGSANCFTIFCDRITAPITV